MSLLPLYDKLLEQLNSLTPDEHIDIERVCYTINNIHKHLSIENTDYHFKMIGALIVHHKSITDKTNIKMIPYNCQIMIGGKGILPTMGNMPVLLQKIIAQYVINYSINT